MYVLGIAIPGVIYTLIVIAGISVFGKEELALLAWPTLELVKTTEVPGLILERLESAFLGVWVAAVFTTVGNLYYATALTIKQVFRLKGHRLIACALLPVFYWLSLKPPNIHVLFKYQSIIGYTGGVLAFLLPACLLLLAILRKRGKSSKDKAINEGEEGVSSV
jgi:spore germination protein